PFGGLPVAPFHMGRLPLDTISLAFQAHFSSCTIYSALPS
ncbi:MAG: hypothetical protein ACI9C2_000221, partial [Gammaproteobacteria bacterium]